MKKIISLAVLFLMLVGLFGCAAEAPAEPQEDRIILDSSNFTDYLDYRFKIASDPFSEDYYGNPMYFDFSLDVSFASNSDRLTFHDVSITLAIDGVCQDIDGSTVRETGTVTVPLDLFGNGYGLAKIYDHSCYLDKADITGFTVVDISGYAVMD